MQILYYYNFYIGQFHFNFSLPHMLHATATFSLLASQHKHAHHNFIFVKGSNRYQEQPSFPILSKLHLFILFSGPSFSSNFYLHAFNPYFVTLCNLQGNSKSFNNINAYTYLVQLVNFELVLVYTCEYQQRLILTGNIFDSTSL